MGVKSYVIPCLFLLLLTVPSFGNDEDLRAGLLTTYDPSGCYWDLFLENLSSNAKYVTLEVSYDRDDYCGTNACDHEPWGDMCIEVSAYDEEWIADDSEELECGVWNGSWWVTVTVYEWGNSSCTSNPELHSVLSSR